MSTIEWDEAGDKAQSSGGGGDWIRMSGGESVVGVVCGKPWAGDKWSPWGVKERFAVNVFDTRLKQMRIFETAPMFFTDLVRCKKKFDAKHGAGKWTMEIAREGEGKNTRYNFSFEEALNAKQCAFVEAEELKDLDDIYTGAHEPREEQGGGAATGSYNGTAVGADESIPF